MEKVENGLMESVLLENEIYQVTVIPRLGGKIASVRRKKDDFEYLFQPKKPYEPPNIYDDFSLFQPSGIDDCFPSIDAESLLKEGKETVYPDHGEIWSAPMNWSLSAPGTIRMDFASAVFHYGFRKEIRIAGNNITMMYSVTNTGESAFPCFYTFHGLFRMEEDMRISYPKGIQRILNVMDHSILGKSGTVHTFPESVGHDFRGLPQKGEPYMMKYYVLDELQEGRCGFTYPSQKASALIEFDVKALPYLGLWMTQGGYQGDFNIALEPSSGFYDSISKAMQHEKITILSPGEAWEFQITLTLS